VFGAGGLSSNYALDFAPHSIECDKLNAILATGEVRAGKTSVWGVKTDMRLCPTLPFDSKADAAN
jgi:hypothetical protein